MFNKTDLIQLVTMTMPYGRFKGRVLIDLPEEYLLWFQKKGFPNGELGKLLALALEIRIHGLEDVLTPLRATSAPNRNHSPDKPH